MRNFWCNLLKAIIILLSHLSPSLCSHTFPTARLGHLWKPLTGILHKLSVTNLNVCCNMRRHWDDDLIELFYKLPHWTDPQIKPNSGVRRWTARDPELHRWQTGWQSSVEICHDPRDRPKDSKVRGKTMCDSLCYIISDENYKRHWFPRQSFPAVSAYAALALCLGQRLWKSTHLALQIERS